MLVGLLEGSSKGLFKKGEEVVDVESKEKLYSGELFNLPAVVTEVGEEDGKAKRAFVTEKAMPATHGYRLAFDFEKASPPPSGATVVEGGTLGEMIFHMQTWPEEKTEAVRVGLEKELLDLDERISGLEAAVSESVAEILAGQQEIKEGLDDLSKQVAAGNEDAEARNARLQALILHQGRDLKILLRGQQQQGNSGTEEDQPGSLLGKWWPREHTVSKTFVARNSEDGQPLINGVHRKLQEETRYKIHIYFLKLGIPIRKETLILHFLCITGAWC